MTDTSFPSDHSIYGPYHGLNPSVKLGAFTYNIDPEPFGKHADISAKVGV